MCMYNIQYFTTMVKAIVKVLAGAWICTMKQLEKTMINNSHLALKPGSHPGGQGWYPLPSRMCDYCIPQESVQRVGVLTGVRSGAWLIPRDEVIIVLLSDKASGKKTTVQRYCLLHWASMYEGVKLAFEVM